MIIKLARLLFCYMLFDKCLSNPICKAILILNPLPNTHNILLRVMCFICNDQYVWQNRPYTSNPLSPALRGRLIYCWAFRGIIVNTSLVSLLFTVVLYPGILFYCGFCRSLRLAELNIHSLAPVQEGTNHYYALHVLHPIPVNNNKCLLWHCDLFLMVHVLRYTT